MRVLVVTNMYPSEYSSRRGIFVQREVDALAGLGHELDVVRIEVLRTRLNYLSGRGRVLSAVRRFEPDIVHVHYGLTLMAIPRGLSAPIITTFHGSDLAIPWQRWVSKRMLAKIAHAIVVAPDMREVPIRHEVPTSVIPCGVPRADAPLPSQGEARAQLGLSSAVHVLFPSSPQRREKQFGLFEETLARIPGAVGITLDEVDPASVQLWMRACDCLLLTSRREGSPVVTKEALCAATRVVSVDVGDVSQQLAGFSGCAVAAADPSALARSVIEVLGQTPPDEALARERFDISIEARAVDRVYSTCIEWTQR